LNLKKEASSQVSDGLLEISSNGFSGQYKILLDSKNRGPQVGLMVAAHGPG